MHEVSIALGIIEEIDERFRQLKADKITTVYLRVGRLTAVDESALQFAWEMATEGTPASNSRLEIEAIPLTIACSTCDCERTIEGAAIPVCPVCGTPSDRIVRGRELSIVAMEVSGDATNGRGSTEHSAQERDVRAGPPQPF